MSGGETVRWWKQAVVYQIYPRSFMDSNGDGIGDLNGITARLDYLQWLGIDVLWICPMYRSPNDDNGYDISDYQAIMTEFGTMADFDRLLAEVHARGMRLILDLVVNHTSDEHPWFIESRSSQSSAKRDWYIWREGKNGAEPNNWESIFNGSAWKYDAGSEQYFLHLFSERQPDLNWENPQVRAALYDMMRWWLDKGIDGFRIDAICHMKKQPGLTDMPNPQGLRYVPSFERHLNYEGLLDYVDDLCEQVFNRYDIMTVGEMNGASAEQGEDWVGEQHGRLNMIFQFEHVKLWETSHQQSPDAGVDVLGLKNIFTRWQTLLEGKGWNALYVENHDIPRVVSKWGDDKRYWRESATAIAAMYFLMQGTPFIYQGQELGMTNTRFNCLADFNDIAARNRFAKLQEQGMEEAQILAFLSRSGRDNSRTPMQWDDSPNAGFSLAKPWFAVNANYQQINVARQREEPDSVLNFYRALIHLRQQDPLWVYGRYQLQLAAHPHIYAYSRSQDERQVLVLCNLSAETQQIDAQDLSLEKRALLLSNYPQEGERQTLRPYEAQIYQ
ncbi:MAG: glycoside hydrolase family 13 protein [Serratia proteamaculans]|uniref:Alpha-amylase n=1 Tax=Serratia proteamaculans TaxID=28151 RepID=A0A7U0RMT0_SERPR|nr:alpha-glucosidase [Serratia proteamaculans]MBO1501731.1 alpha-glucosidase [Serratia proteamaculans]MDW5508463.1 alpha-glucosidase [Serratia proteamaculans]QQX52921.1 alpha-glucosidase [Serratia proteamaculans]HCV65164.1 glucohydrolase [Serratia sp. (in: enterobacteria)]